MLGFGARAMRDEQKPKYLNTSDNDVYHKGRTCTAPIWRAPTPRRAGEVILCEGYTDVIALHQAGLRNAVGLMGTALTDEQVGELARMAQTVLLALDADSAGQEAMLKAARLAAKRKLELRVVALPAGADPADLVQREGRRRSRRRSRTIGRVRALSGRARARQRGRLDPRGPRPMLEELRPVFATLPPSAMRMELTRVVSGRLGLSEGLAESCLRQGPADRAWSIETIGQKPERDGGAARQITRWAAGRRGQRKGSRQAGCSPRARTPSVHSSRCASRRPRTASALEEFDLEAYSRASCCAGPPGT